MRNIFIIAVALCAAGCGTSTITSETTTEADRLGSIQHGLQLRLEERFGKGARLERVFGSGDQVALGVRLEDTVEESDVRTPMAIGRYHQATDVLEVVSTRPEFTEARLLAGGVALVTSGGELKLLAADGAERMIAAGVKGEVWAAGDERLLFTLEGGARTAGDSALALTDAQGVQTVLADAEGVDDRPAISPDGETVIFVSGRSGVASLWRTTLGGAAAVQLTNQGLQAGLERDGAPEGFVPPPVTAEAIAWVSKDVVRYDAGDEEIWSVNVRTGVATREGGAR